jgi:aminoglycoside 6'-N-acetyltransferase I
MKIREAKGEDAAAWAVLRTELWPDCPGDHAPEIAAYLAGNCRDVVQAYVAESASGELVGFIELNIRNYAEGTSARRVPYVEGWMVAAQHRGRGVGRALMARAERWARDGGFDELASDAEIANERSIAAHKRLGFAEQDRIVCFLKRLT